MDKHEVTMEAVAITQITLRQAREAVVVAKGMDALAIRDTVEGTLAAKEVVEKHFKDYTHLPEIFWRSLQQTSSYAATKHATPANTKSQKTNAAVLPKTPPLAGGSGASDTAPAQASLAGAVSSASGNATPAKVENSRRGLKRSRA